MKVFSEIDTIKRSLTEACKTGNAYVFKLALFSDKVKVEYPSKDIFFEFFQERIESTHDEVEGNLYLKIRLPNQDDDFTEAYEFYSQNHLYSQLCILIKESNEVIEIDVMPF